MSDESGQSGQEQPQEQAPKWGDSLDRLSDERKEELARRLREWKPEMATDQCKGPFDGLELNGLEVFWVAICAYESFFGNITLAEQRLKVAAGEWHPTLISFDLHFSGAVLSGALLQDAYLASAELQNADLAGAHLERAILDSAQLQDAILTCAHLQGTHLIKVQSSHARFWGADLQGAVLRNADLPYAEFNKANLQNAEFREAHLEHTEFREAHLEQADLSFAYMQNADLSEAYLQNAVFSNTHLQGAAFGRSNLHGADLNHAELQGASFYGAFLERADFSYAQLSGAYICGANFDKTSRLNGATLTNVVLDQVIFDNTNLAVVDWSLVPRLGDEHIAWQKTYAQKDGPVLFGMVQHGDQKDLNTRLEQFQTAVRANRTLAVTLRNQGMNEDADRFAYRAQLLHQEVLWRQRKYSGYFFSYLLKVLAGYGYKPRRALGWYLASIFGFACAYYLIGHASGVIPGPVDAVVFSLTSFHGRGFFPSENISLHSPVIVLAALEAVIGLLIEISFIATFTQRFFGR